MIDVMDRLEKMYAILARELEMLEIEKKIGLRVRKQMEKIQKDYYLRQQIQAIQKELGEDEDISSEADKYREKLKKIKAPKEAKEKIAKEMVAFVTFSKINCTFAISLKKDNLMKH